MTAGPSAEALSAFEGDGELARDEATRVELQPYRPPLDRPAAGIGRLELVAVAGRTAVVVRRAASPLKLLTPRGLGPTARVVVGTYGGGLLAGDDVRLSVVVGAGARAVLGTQASTKVYRSDGSGRTARQSVIATIDDGAVLAMTPDPVTCFAAARYEQRQAFDLAPDASLMLVDWLTSGRAARGERWALARYRAEVRVRVGGRLVAHDALLLDPRDGPIDAPHRMGRFDCLATAILVGPAFAGAAAGLAEEVAATRLQRRAALVAGASPIAAGGGVLVRVAGPGAEAVGRLLRSLLAGAFDALGGDPWARKW